jgi:hypothetical protein
MGVGHKHKQIFCMKFILLVTRVILPNIVTVLPFEDMADKFN